MPPRTDPATLVRYGNGELSGQEFTITIAKLTGAQLTLSVTEHTEQNG
jgi:hypothetical protein